LKCNIYKTHANIIYKQTAAQLLAYTFLLLCVSNLKDADNSLIN